MITMIRQRDADCDGGSTHYVICDDYDIASAYYYADTEDEADKYVRDNFTQEEIKEYFGRE